MKLTFLILSLLTFSRISYGQKNLEDSSLKLSDFTFNSIFARNTKDKENLYCLLATGWIRAPRSENLDSLIETWITKHRSANIIPVYSMEPIDDDNPTLKQVFCIVTDDKDTLNNFLVRNGCFPGVTMVRPNTWDEMSEDEKRIYDNKKEYGEIKVFIDEKAYQTFIEQIKSAEQYAYDNRIGIWKDENLRHD